jgi:ABC-type antimicrobial peptide transport system permease subunit
LNLWKLLFRAWFYFRQGYNLYLAFLIGFASNIVVLYRLGVAPNKDLSIIFPSLTIFIIVGLLVSIPVGILAGLYHMKRTAAFAADVSVQTEANPYVYKTIGKEKEVFLPLWILTARGLAKVLERQETMTAEDRKELEEILNKANALLEGQYVGLPKQLGVRSFRVSEGDR